MLNQRQVNSAAQVRLHLDQIDHNLVFGTVLVGGKEDLVGYRFAAQVQGAQPKGAVSRSDYADYYNEFNLKVGYQHLKVFLPLIIR